MRRAGRFHILAAYDINPRALAQCQEEDGARPARSYEELLDTPGAEAVVISTGAKFHAEQALAAMARGLHVFVEKPLCSTPAEMSALLDAQARTGRVVGVGHNDQRTDPVSRYIQEIIETGELGKVAYFEMTSGHHGGFCIKPGDWRGDPERNPGGMLFQCGVHGIHELLFHFGPVARVSSLMRYDVHTTATADVAICTLEFVSGVIGTLNSFHVCPYRHYFNIYGTRRNLYRESLCFDEGTRLYTQTFTVDNVKEPWVPVTLPAADSATGKSSCGSLLSFYDAVVHGGTPYPSLVDGARAVAVVFAAEESAKTGRVVEVPQPTEASASSVGQGNGPRRQARKSQSQGRAR